ncbi:MAG: alpha/beta hydrolase [Micrococcales bacterium]|nr:alpha/beta hydrolase [Micrococcales bacterium]
MPLDPGLAELLAMTERSGAPPLHTLDPEGARAAYRRLGRLVWRESEPRPVGSTQDLTFAGPAGELAARVYRPSGSGPWPTVLFIHGGGWVIGGIDTHDPTSRDICELGQSVVVSVDYRLAPEAPYPAAVEDSLAAARWVLDHRAELGGSDEWAVAGDSAGGNLAAVVALHARDEGWPTPIAQLLIYPSVDQRGPFASREENGTGYSLDLPTMAYFSRHYAHGAELDHHTLSPLRAASHAGLPPAVIVTAELDPLRDEGEAYAAVLREAGVAVEYVCFPGLIHGFIDKSPISTGAASAVEQMCAMFRRALHPGSPSR